jgi:hypothetical protein
MGSVENGGKIHETRKNPNKQGMKVMWILRLGAGVKMEPKIGVEPTTC